MDNYATHKTEPIRKWLGARPRWHVHFTPTASSWVNQVERFFADVTEKQIRRGVHRSTAELQTAIRAYLDAVNADPKPFRWTKSADDILAAIKRFCLKPSTSPQPKPKSHKPQNQDTLMFAVSARKCVARVRAFREWPRLSRAGAPIIKTTVDHALMRRVGYRRTGDASAASSV